jgi:capsular polysaccharide biosynthesis protein
MQEIKTYWDVLVRRWQIVIAMPVLAMIAAALVTFAIKPTYQATATIALAPATLSIPTTNQLPPYYLSVDSPRRLPLAFTPAYYIAILQDADLASQVSPRASVTIAANASDRALIEITARGEDARLVADAANAYARVGAQRVEQLLTPSGDDVVTAKKKLDTADQALIKFGQANNLGEYDLGKYHAASGLSTSKRLELDQLLQERDDAQVVYRDFYRDHASAIILAASAYKPRVITTAVPGSPTSPKLAQNILTGAAFGLLIGIAGAFAFEWMRVKKI